MDGEMIQRLAAARTEELPGTGVSWPFGPDWDVFKVRDRVFMLQTRITGEPIVILKAWPADGAALREAYQEITPGYHMNKKHWITLNPGEKIDAQLVEDLVTESYLLVLEHNVPKSRWPVDPSTFGRAQGNEPERKTDPAHRGRGRQAATGYEQRVSVHRASAVVEDCRKGLPDHITRSLVEQLVEDSHDLAEHQAQVKDRPKDDV